MNRAKERIRDIIGRFRLKSPIRAVAAIAGAAAACLICVLALSYVSLTSTSQYEIKGLRLSQDGIYLEATWLDAGAPTYKAFLFSEKQKPQVYTFRGSRGRIPLKILGKEYRLFLLAENERGGLSAAVTRKAGTEKLAQTIKTSRKDYEGIEGKKESLEAQAKGRLRFSASDPKTADVSGNGVIYYSGEGRSYIRIRAGQTNQYKAAEKRIWVKTYPKELEKPKLKIKNLSSVEAKITWDKVKYAQQYTLFRHDPLSDRYEKIGTFKEGDERSLTVLRDQADYMLRASAKIQGEKIKSKAPGKAEVKSTAKTAETYDSSHNLGTLDYSRLDLVTKISGKGGANVPQSMSKVGDEYVVTYVNMGGTVGAFVAYTADGKPLGTRDIRGMGHANGSTYSPVTDEILTVKTHKQIRSAECTAYSMSSASGERSFQLPKFTSGIAYDESSNRFYLSKGNELYLANTEFEIKEYFPKKIRYNHAQDIGAYNGVAMVCTWVSGNESYIDLYRMSDGEYLGSYYVPIGEIESCFVDNKHLIILMNNGTKGYGDCILRTTEPIDIP